MSTHLLFVRYVMLNFISKLFTLVWYQMNPTALRSYKEEHGHTNVTVRENHSLGHWVHNQRTHYRRKREGTPSTMTDERENALNALGFVWRRGNIGIKKDHSLYDEQWNKMREGE